MWCGLVCAGSSPRAYDRFLQVHASHIGRCGVSLDQSILTDTLYATIVSLNVSEGLGGKGDRPAALDEGPSVAILASISLHYDRLRPIIVC